MALKKKLSLILLLISWIPAISLAACEINQDGKKIPFDGTSLESLQVEKRSLPILNKEFPILNAAEKAFKGEIQTCTSCQGRFVSCER